VLAGCANNPGPAGSSAAASSPAPSSAAASSPAASGTASPAPSGEPSAGKPTASGAQTISGTIAEGVEPHCLILRDSGGSHVLFFDDPGLRSAAKAGSRVTLTGRSEPTMMTTCQQGVPFIVSSVKPG
jgi:hypothetical protein